MREDLAELAAIAALLVGFGAVLVIEGIPFEVRAGAGAAIAGALFAISRLRRR